MTETRQDAARHSDGAHGRSTPAAKVVVSGQGYVGLALARRAVEVGDRVVGFDTNAERVKLLAEGESYIEGISAETLVAALASGCYVPTSDPRQCAGFDVAAITVSFTEEPLINGTRA